MSHRRTQPEMLGNADELKAREADKSKSLQGQRGVVVTGCWMGGGGEWGGVPFSIAQPSEPLAV